jgi:hypothetical protein
MEGVGRGRKVRAVGEVVVVSSRTPWGGSDEGSQSPPPPRLALAEGLTLENPMSAENLQCILGAQL